MNAPRLLELYCGGGGSATGYARAGFDVTGVDIADQPNFPFRFVKADIQAWAEESLHSGFPSIRGMDLERDFDAIAASPPCQHYTTMNNRWGSKSPPLIDVTRRLLEQTGLPYVLENVQGARHQLYDPVRLTGEMFGLRVHRPRLFETNWPLMAPKAPGRQRDAVAVYGKMDGRRLFNRSDGSILYAASDLEEARAAMGVDWMIWDELREAVPPAYTELVGAQLRAWLARASRRSLASAQTQVKS